MIDNFYFVSEENVKMIFNKNVVSSFIRKVLKVVFKVLKDKEKDRENLQRYEGSIRSISN